MSAKGPLCLYSGRDVGGLRYGRGMGALMVRTLTVLGLGLMIGGCCTAVRERVGTYSRTAADNAAATRVLVERCRDGDREACDAALQALEDQRIAAETLGGGVGGTP